METKICNTCCVEKPPTEFGPHKTAVDGYNPKCKSCVSEYNREYRQRNRERIIENDLRYAAANREQARERAARWRKDNPNRVKRNEKQYYQQNKERELEKSKQRHKQNKKTNCERSKQWRLDSPDRVAAQTAKRRATKKQAVPSWVDLDIVARLYLQAVELTESTGVSHQVDHIVPLNSDVVCGLHCEDNLRVITAEENNAKKNKLIGE